MPLGLKVVSVAVLLILLAGGLIVFFTVTIFKSSNDQSEIALSDIDEKFSYAGNLFATKLYQNSIESTSSNVIISPVSVQTILSLTMFGAIGETKKEMKNGLNYQEIADQSVVDNYKKLSQFIRKTNGLKIANKIYVMENYSINPTFKDIATKSFDSSIQELNFVDRQKSASEINDWVGKQTNNKITEIIDEKSLGGVIRMVLVNAIYFKGIWTYQFDKELTYKGRFYFGKDETKFAEVNFMNIEEHFKYRDFANLDASAIQLPYKNSSIAMMIILPNKLDGLAELESKLNTIDFGEMSKKMYEQEVFVFLPKFKIEFDISLNNPLKKMGMKRMFSQQAEFNNLLETPKNLQMSEVVHKAFIEVNEEGAEAAAATAVLTYEKSGYSRVFRANHPFLFALMCTESNAVYFIGRLNNPGSSE